MQKIPWLITIIVIIAAVLLVYGVQTGKLFVDNQPVPSNSNQQGLSFSTETIHQTDNFYDIHVEYPQFLNIESLNTKISSLISGKIATFKEESKNNWEARRATATPENPVPENPEFPFSFIAEWKPVQLNNDYISFVINLYYFVGGAHGTNEIYAFNYDVKGGKEITIMDFLNSSQQTFENLAALVKQQAILQLQSDEFQIDTNDSLKQMMDDGTKPTLENYQNFNFNYNSLIIYFQQYQVAPGAIGPVTITLYKDVLESNSIKSDYLK
jgi:hypothetical protein